MKIDELEIANFKAIKSAHLKNLGALVVIAGQNGSGKSAIFDAIRLLKTVYGGYQGSNEFQQWLGEMQIDFRDPKSVLSIFNDRNQKLLLRMKLTLHKDEKEYLRKNATNLMSLGQAGGQPWGLGDMRNHFISKPVDAYKKSLETHQKELVEALLAELNQPQTIAELEIKPGDVPVPDVKVSLALGTLFSTFVRLLWA